MNPNRFLTEENVRLEKENAQLREELKNNGWISVEDRLPEKLEYEELYLVLLEEDEQLFHEMVGFCAEYQTSPAAIIPIIP